MGKPTGPALASFSRREPRRLPPLRFVDRIGQARAVREPPSPIREDVIGALDRASPFGQLRDRRSGAIVGICDLVQRGHVDGESRNIRGEALTRRLEGSLESGGVAPDRPSADTSIELVRSGR